MKSYYDHIIDLDFDLAAETLVESQNEIDSVKLCRFMSSHRNDLPGLVDILTKGFFTI